MYLSKTKIGVFILAILILGWLLYPRELFLAFIYEGFSELKQSEEFYLDTLQKRPLNKFATLRLAQLYERTGEPERATPLLKALQNHRGKDWQVAEAYLSHLERLHDDETLFGERLRIAQDFQKIPRFPKLRIQGLLDDAYHQARWRQRTEESVEILTRLIAFSPRPKPYQLEQQDIDRATKNSGALIATLRERLKKDPRDKSSLEELIRVYRLMGRDEEALALTGSALEYFPKDLEFLMTDAELKKETGHRPESLALYQKIVGILENDLQKFPKDREKEKKLVEIYLYELEDDTRWPRYENYLEENPEETLAIDVAYLLEKKGRDVDALNWARKMRERFPHEEKLDLIIFDLLIRQKRYPEALKLGEAVLSRQTDDPDTLQKVAYLHTLSGNPERGVELYKKLAASRKEDPETLLMVGRELFFLGKNAESKQILRQAIALKPNEYEPWFWLAEIQHSGGEKKESQDSYQMVLDLTRVHQTPLEQKRIMLKSAGRLSFNNEIRERYHELIRRHPDSRELVADLLELLMENQEWEEAIPLLEKIRKTSPKNRAARRDLAHAYVESGRWIPGINEYEELLCETGAADVAYRLKELHEKYDGRVGPTFQWLDLGSDDLMEWGLEASDFIHPEWSFHLQTVVGRHRVPALNFSGIAEYGRLALTSHHFKKTGITFGSGYGLSEARKTGSPFLEFAYHPISQISLKTGIEFRALRTDIPQAVRAGSIQDRTFFQSDLTLWNRLLFLSTYRYGRNVLPSGVRSHEHLVEPALSWIILHKPYLSVGYLFSFVHVTDEGGYLNTVSLLPKIRSHYLTSSFDYTIHRNLVFEAGFYIGEDTVRNLHIWEADLFGTRGGFKWAALRWLDINSSYEFGRESLQGLPGEGHRVRAAISGHWF